MARFAAGLLARSSRWAAVEPFSSSTLWQSSTKLASVVAELSHVHDRECAGFHTLPDVQGPCSSQALAKPHADRATLSLAVQACLFSRSYASETATDNQVANRDENKPNLMKWTSRISYLCKTGRIAEAVQAYADGKQKGMEADEYVFTALIGGYGRSGDLAKAVEIFKEAKEAGCAGRPFVWNSLIGACSRMKKMNEAEQMVAEMEASGCQPDVVTYQTMVHWWAISDGGLEQSEKWFQRMKDEKVQPHEQAQQSLILGRARAGKLSEAEALLNEFLEGGGQPWWQTYLQLAKAADAAGEFTKAEEYTRKAKEPAAIMAARKPKYQVGSKPGKKAPKGSRTSQDAGTADQ